jgi:2-polyprenyl-3-methyl-5-hydroxy-6-metoxy-1,4-benzoquinol methylase
MMSMSSPQAFFETINAFHRTGALKAAIELDVFTAIADGCDTPDELARRCATSLRGMRILCGALVGLGMARLDGSRYALTRNAALFLNRRSPAYLGDAAKFLASSEIVARSVDLASRMREDASRVDAVVAAEHPVWLEYARAMAPIMAPTAEQIAQLEGACRSRSAPLRVLDVAAGHGLFGIAVARWFSHARVVALDWEGVLNVARENASAAGVLDRFEFSPGDAREAVYDACFDLVIVANFLHHFDAQTCLTLLRRIERSLSPDGLVVIVEFVLNEDRASPPAAVTFALTMLELTEGGEAYTGRELVELLSTAGLPACRIAPLLEQQAIVAARRVEALDAPSAQGAGRECRP